MRYIDDRMLKIHARWKLPTKEETLFLARRRALARLVMAQVTGETQGSLGLEALNGNAAFAA